MTTKYKLLLLDRDGVLNQKLEEGDYVTNRSRLLMFQEVLAKVAKLTQQIRVAVVTNQQGVGKDLMSRDELESVNEEINEQIVRFGGQKIVFFVCTHVIDIQCGCRKPKPGLILEAMSRFQVLSQETILIGDQESDREAAKSAKIDFLKTDNPEMTISHIEKIFQVE